MIIREYTKADHESCTSVFKSNLPKFFVDHELVDFENWLAAKDKSQIAYKTNTSEFYYVVIIDKKTVACGGFYLPQNGDEARMAWGMVDSAFHKKGIGSQFLKFRIEQIKLINPQIAIALDTTQYSYPFFEKLGFDVIKIQKDYYAPGFDRYDMVKKVTSDGSKLKVH